MHQIVTGDNLLALARMPDACIDAIVTDPPYGLGKEPDALAMLRAWSSGSDHEIKSKRGFMGKTWDAFVPQPSLWRECLRVLKPGGHLLAFFGTRTYDIGTLAIRMAGFEIRDQLAWMYGTGFPKSKNIAMSIDKGEGIIGHRSVAALTAGGDLPPPDLSVGPYVPEGDTPGAAWQGWGTALKPAQEPIVLARKPLIGTVAANVLAHGTGGLNVDATRIGSAGGTRDTPTGAPRSNVIYGKNGATTSEKPEGLGRWPANVLFDETAAAALDEHSKSGTQRAPKGRGGIWPTAVGQAPAGPQHGDSGGASRFFYVAKTSKAEREAGLDHMRQATAGAFTGGRTEGSAGLENPRAGAGRTSSGRANTHPTVKPIALMRYLVRLITPPGGVVLDPFAGSGTTIIAAVQEGFTGLGLELDPDYAKIARARIAHWAAESGPTGTLSPNGASPARDPAR